MNLKLTSMLAVLASAAIFSGTALAQKNYRSSNDSYTHGVTIYEHCGFQGESRTLTVGEYSSMRRIGFGNDSISSISVPKGFEAVIYQHDDFRGSYAQIKQDIKCFDHKWNDKASSVRIRQVQKARNDNANNRQSYNGRDYDNQRRDGYNQQNQDKNRVNGKNVSQVTFDGASLSQVSKKTWTLNRKRAASSQFEELRRDSDSVYLQNKYTAERVRIDLFANDVTIVSRDGRQQRYSIDKKYSVLEASKPSKNGSLSGAKNSEAKSRDIRSQCFNFKAYTSEGDGSVRFFNEKKELFRFNRKAKTGRVCHSGKLRMEIGKNQKGASAIVEINGHAYHFSAGEKEDQYLNNWYRKNVTFRVGG